MVACIIRKAQHMYTVGENHAQRVVLLEELQICKDPKRALEIMEEIDKMYIRDKLLGFAEHPEVVKQETPEKKQMMQDKFQLASTYSDEWCSTFVDGEVV